MVRLHLGLSSQVGCEVVSCPVRKHQTTGSGKPFQRQLENVREVALGNQTGRDALPREGPRHAFAPGGVKPTELLSCKVARDGIEPPTRGFSER